jgi:hypothetical protein
MALSHFDLEATEFHDLKDEILGGLGGR